MNEDATKLTTTTQLVINRYSNGNIRSKTPYVNDKQHGQALEWYESGAKKRETMWVRGKKHGLDTHLWESGKRLWQIISSAGGQIGTGTRWAENGTRWGEGYYFKQKQYVQIQWDEEKTLTKISFHPLMSTNASSKLKRPLAKGQKNTCI